MNETQQKIYTQAKGKWDAIAKPIDSLGVFEDMVARLCAIAGTVNPGDYKRRALLTLCADHGVVAEGVTQTDASVTKVVAENIAHGCSGVNYMAQMAGVDVYAVDIGMRGEAYPDATFGMGHMINRKVQAGTGNLAKEPAMSMEICDRAIEAGKELVRECKEKGYEILAVGEMGIGNTAASSMWMTCLTGIPLIDCVGAGSGLDNEGVKHKYNVLRKALENYKGDNSTVDVIRYFGGYEMVMAVGGMLRAAELKMVILVDGFIMTNCVLAASHLYPEMLPYCIFGHCGDEAGHKRVLDILQAKPLLNLGLRLGEGSGSVCAYPIVDSAVRMINEMHSFQQASITKYF